MWFGEVEDLGVVDAGAGDGLPLVYADTAGHAPGAFFLMNYAIYRLK